MKQFFITLGLVLVIIVAAVASANASETKREGNNFTQVTTVQQSSDIKTAYTYTIKDTTYPIWITKNGRCYIVRVSKNGNEYKQYLDKSICLQICYELGIDYVESKSYDSQH